MGIRKSVVSTQLRARLTRIHVLSYAEMQRLLSVISDVRDRALFLIAYRHGLRASEVVQMQQVDVDFPNSKISIRRIGRGMQDQHALQKDELHALKQYVKTRIDDSVSLFLGLRGKPLTRRGLDWLIKMYGREAKLPTVKCHFHALKHSIATHLLGVGIDLKIVHRWLGHTAIKNTSYYVHFATTPADKNIIPALLGVLPT
jgi:integrase